VDRSEVLSDGSSSRRSIPLTETQSLRACAGSEVSTDIDNDVKHSGFGELSLRDTGLISKEKFKFDAIEEAESSDSSDWLDVKSQIEVSLKDTEKSDEIGLAFSKLSSSFAFSEMNAESQRAPLSAGANAAQLQHVTFEGSDSVSDEALKCTNSMPNSDNFLRTRKEELVDYGKLSSSFAFSEWSTASAQNKSQEISAAFKEDLKWQSTTREFDDLEDALDDKLENDAESSPTDATPAEEERDPLIVDNFPPHIDNIAPHLPVLAGPGNDADAQADPNNMPFFFDDVDDQPPADIEIHLILDEIIGIRAPVINILMNASWLLLFNCLFVIIFGFTPYMLGSTATNSVRLIMSPILSSIENYICPDTETECSMYTIFSKFPLQHLFLIANTIHEESLKFDGIVKPIDLLRILEGYTIAVLLVLFLGNLILMATSLFPNILGATFNRKILMSTSVVKVGFFLFVRIFCLPVVLGCIFLLILNTRTQYTTSQIITFIAKDIISFMYLCWASGISYMLTVTLAVLQIREVFHPRVLANVIRSHEPHHTLLISLVVDSIPTHIRRIIISMFVYVLFLIIFVFLPLFAVSYIFPDPTPLELWYGIPELQVPFELVISHIVFLALVDLKKDFLGTWQHAWFVYISRVFGMQRFLLPILKESEEVSFILKIYLV
jgi:hypothetical protein